LSRLLTAQHDHVLVDCHTLAIEPFLHLEPELQAALLRQWLRDQEIVGPPRKRLNEFLFQLNSSGTTTGQPELRWAQRMIKRHGKLLWLHRLPVPVLDSSQLWTSGMKVDLGPDFGTIGLSGNSLLIPEGWELGPRRKSARMRLHTGGPRRKLKELMRECGIPPWLRTAVPVLYWHGEVAALGDWLFSAEFQNFLCEHATTYAWRPGHPLLCKLQSVSVRFLDRSLPGGIIE
jgi:tRNA(Ile)-lysidine synthase